MEIPAASGSNFPHAETRAAQMLRRALDVNQREKGISIRKLGAQLGYKQAAVLSHMASGRVPIPLERALDIAEATDLDPGDFLAACVEQRNPDAKRLLRSFAPEETSSFSLVSDLNVIAGGPLDEMTDGQKLVMREAASDSRASRRWLSAAELPLIELVRRLRPSVTREGLTPSDLSAIESALKQNAY